MKKTIALIAPLFLLLIGCADKAAQKEAKTQSELIADQSQRVTFTQPTIEPIESLLEIHGSFEAMQSVAVGAKVAGRVTLVTVSDGSPVRRGQTIAMVDTTSLMAEVQRAQAGVDAALSAKLQAQTQAAMSPEQTQAAIKQAEAGLKAARARLDLVRKGPREQEKRSAQDRVNAAKSAMEKAKADLERFRKLYEQDAVAKADLDAAQLAYDTALSNYQTALEMLDMTLEGSRPEEIRQAEEAVTQASEQLRNARASSMMDSVRKQQVVQADAQLREARARLTQARQALSDASIVAPVDGFVSGRPAQVGQVVSPGTPVAQIVSLNGVYLEGQIPEGEIAKVTTGLQVRVNVASYQDKTFEGTVVAVRPVADSLGRLFTARIAVNDPSKLLRPGMFADASLVLGRTDDAILLPVDAIISKENKAYVFVDSGGKAKRIEIKTGANKDGKVQVFDLSPNEKVVLKGKDLLTDGTVIKEDK
ncbi:MAG: efflux RND transporter periplasmic adaptor subunit [Fimbriimonadales bacterium]